MHKRTVENSPVAGNGDQLRSNNVKPILVVVSS